MGAGRTDQYKGQGKGWRNGHGPGTRLRHDGYVQITRHGPWRWVLEHVYIMLMACREMCYYPVKDGLPPGLTVEHLDHNRAHNCMCNLMLLDKRIHDVLSAEYRHRRSRALRAGYTTYSADGREPDWITSDAL